MTRRTIIVVAIAAAALVAPTSAFAAKGGGHGGGGGGTGGSPSASVAYNSIPAALPGNVSSLGFEATRTSEFGDLVGVADSSVGKTAKSVSVVLSSWACESGSWTDGSCETTPGSNFVVPMTARLYSADLGTVLAVKTQLVTVPYRPSADPTCTDQHKWLNAADGICYNGLASTVTFNFDPKSAPALPASVAWTVSFSTSTAGPEPLGTGTVCYTSPGGCAYDSLNVGAQTFPVTAGSDTEADTVLNSDWSGAYCDALTAVLGQLQQDAGCWTGYRPLATIRTK